MAQWVEVRATDGTSAPYFLYYMHKECGQDYKEYMSAPDRKLSLRAVPGGDAMGLICEQCSHLDPDERHEIHYQKHREAQGLS